MGSDKMESRPDFSSSEKKHVVADDEGLVESPDDLRGVRRAQLRGERRALFCPCDLSHTPPHLRRAMQSLESIDSGVSLKSDRSKAEPFDFKDRVSPRDRLRKSHSSGIISASVRRKDSQGCTADVKDTPPSPKEKMAERRAQLFPCDLSHTPLHLIMVLKSMEACGSSLSLMNDSFIRTGQRSPPREEMNQELSSEVGGKHN